MPDLDARSDVRDRYARFAREEAPGRSALYEEWAHGVAGDDGTQEILARIAPTHRQPPLVFAVTRLLGAPEAGYPEWARWLRENARDVVAECGARSIQTNEPLRCAALLPALALIPGPIALLEVGVSAGLCLYPDRYAYRYRSREGAIRDVAPVGGSTLTLESALVGDAEPPLSLPDVRWRAGIDLAPLDPRLPETQRWLTGLVWPGESGRAERVRSALAIAAADPPLLVAGDAGEQLESLAALAPTDATLVITTPGVLAHVPRAGRRVVIDAAKRLGRWVTIDHPDLHDGWSGPVAPGIRTGGFAVAVDGDVVALADPLGGWVEWRGREGQHAR